MRINTPARLTSAVRTTITSTLVHKPLRSLMLLGLIAAAVTIVASTVASAESLKQLIASVGFSSGGGSVSQPKAALAPVTANSSLTTAMQPSDAPTFARRAHTATLLADGRVLIVGGENTGGVISQSEIFEPTAGTFSVAGNLSSPRADHSATRLADGRLLIAGGRGPAGTLTTTEVFDPTTGNFASGPAMSVARAGHSATLFADGRVLIAGGDAAGSAELLDVTAGGSTAVGSMSSARMMHSAALLQDGRVLIVGGRDAAGNELSSGEIFDTPSGSFSPVSSALVVSRVRPHLRVLFDGKVQIIGGSNDGSMEIYDPLYEGFGAYAHVLPESDTCAGLPAQILGSQTRAALFHNGQTDTLLDRTGHTITELNGQALVVGGVNSSGAVLDSSSVLSSSSSSLTTDKMDYAPGEIATITGRGFQAGETVRVKIHEDPHTPQERGFDATADADGNFTGEYLVQDYDLDMKFIVGARGLTSGATAQTTMTDSQPTAVTLTPNTQTVNPGNSGVYTVNVTMGGNAINCPMTLSAPFSAPAPVGVTTAFSGGATITTNANFSKTLTLTTTNTGPMAGRTQPGTYPFTLTVARGAGCQGSGNTTTSGTLIVASPNVAPVASSVTISGTPQYGQLLTGNYTYFDADSDAEGASTFRWLRNGATQVGTNQTYTAVSADVGQTLTFEVTPVAATGTSPGTAVQSPSVTINKKSVTASVTASNKIYDGNTTATITGCTLTGVLAGDTANVTCTAAGPNTFSNANVGTGKTVTATNISLSGSASGNYVLSSTSATTTADITTRAITATLTANDKIYDGNITEPDASMSCSLTGVLAGDSANINCTATSGTFNSPNVATANQVTATVTISGTAASNYTLGAAGTATTSTSATATAHITPKTLTASIIGNPTKTYDGNTTAILAPANFSLTGLIGSESFAVTQTTGSYNSADVATATTVTASLSAGDFTPGVGTLASNYNLPTSASGAGQILRADAIITVTPFNGVYDGNAHGVVSSSATGVNSEALSGLVIDPTTYTNVPGGSIHWTFTNPNYNDQSGDVDVVINKADATVIVNGYSGTYDAAAHGASGTATGVGGVDLSAGLNLGATFTDYPGGTANWTFTGGTNYNDQNGTAAIVINKADAVIVVTPYNVTYDANPHTATGTATGVSGENLGGLNLGGTTHTNAGNFTDAWTFTDVTGNYNDTSGNVNDAIGKANATINVTPYSVTYDGAAHTATGTATGVLSEILSGLDLTATSHTNAGTYNGDAWTFTDVSGNYNDTSGTVNDSIGQASSSTMVICPASVIYSGSAQTPCTASATGAGSLNESLTVNHSNNTDAGTATASASFAGDANHTGSSDSKDFTINKRTLTVAIVGDPTKTYDGNTNATLSSANFLLGNLVAGQNITVIKTTGSYNSKDVITANLVSTTLVSGDFTAGMGTTFNNYNLPASASGPGHITPKTLAITAEDKSFLFGGTMPTLTAAYNAFAAGEGVGNLTGALVLTVNNASNVAVPFNASTPSGTYTIIPSGVTSTNYTITFNNGTLTIGSWTLLGFYQPVDMSTPTAFVLNTVKGGSTVPLKFNIYAGAPGPLTERKSVTDVLFSSIQVAEYNCLQTPGYESPVDVSSTGSTSLRYDGTGAQFIQNWQTPKGANRCYQVRMTALDGSHLDAFFKTK